MYSTVLPLLSLALFWLLPVNRIFAQNFQRQYAAAFDNAFSKVIRSGPNYSVLGRDQATAGGITNRILSNTFTLNGNTSN